MKNSIGPSVVLLVLIFLFSVNTSRAGDGGARYYAQGILISLLVDGGSCSELVDGIRGYFGVRNKLKIDEKLNKIVSLEPLISFCKRTGHNDLLCEEIEDIYIKKNKYFKENLWNWLIHHFSNKSLSVKKLEELISQLEEIESFENIMIKEAKKAGVKFKERLLESALYTIEIMVLIKKIKEHRVNISRNIKLYGNLLEKEQDIKIDSKGFVHLGQGSNHYEKEKRTTRVLINSCHEYQKGVKHSTKHLIKSRIEYIVETYKIPIEKIIKQICAGKNPFLCKAYTGVK